jgi:hypothetical protein
MMALPGPERVVELLERLAGNAAPAMSASVQTTPTRDDSMPA